MNKTISKAINIIDRIVSALFRRKRRHGGIQKLDDELDDKDIARALAHMKGSEGWYAVIELLDRETIRNMNAAMDPGLSNDVMRYHIAGADFGVGLKGLIETHAQEGAKREQE